MCQLSSAHLFRSRFSTCTRSPPTDTLYTKHTRTAKRQIHSSLLEKEQNEIGPWGKITKHRKAKQQERPVLLDRAHARTQPAIRFEKGTETVTVHPVTCAVMPICWARTVLAFPCVSLFPSILPRCPPGISASRFSLLDLPARYTRGTMDKLDKRYKSGRMAAASGGPTRCERAHRTRERMLL